MGQLLPFFKNPKVKGPRKSLYVVSKSNFSGQVEGLDFNKTSLAFVFHQQRNDDEYYALLHPVSVEQLKTLHIITLVEHHQKKKSNFDFRLLYDWLW